MDDIVASLEHQSCRVTTTCGTGALVWRRWPTRRSGPRPPIVLLHGGSGSWTHWARSVPALMNTYEVWAADLPGLGDSAMPPEPLTPASSASVVAAGIRALFPFERRLHLVGFSFGAQVGTLAAVGLGYQLQSLTIVGSAALGLPRARKRLPKEHPGMTAAERNAAHRATLEMLMFHDRRRIDDLTIRIQAENVRRARFRSRTFAFGDEIRRSLPAVRVPVNAVWGRHDATAELGPDACFAVLREHHPELVARTIEDAGHWVMHEQPDAFNAALVDMLALRE